MTFERIDGPARFCICTVCSGQGIGGSESYKSAATGGMVVPNDWYIDQEAVEWTEYCANCAAKLVQEDPTRSRNQFYLDTKGEVIDPTI